MKYPENIMRKVRGNLDLELDDKIVTEKLTL